MTVDEGGGHWLTVREVAKRCLRSEETVRRWIWSGKLSARKLGNQLFIDETEVARLQQGRTSDARAEYRASDSSRQRTTKGDIKFPPRQYDVEQKVRELEDDVKFGQMLREKYGPVDVTELLRQVREEGGLQVEAERPEEGTALDIRSPRYSGDEMKRLMARADRLSKRLSKKYGYQDVSAMVSESREGH